MQFIKRFDIFGVHPQFYIMGKGIYQSFYGSFLTLLLGAIAVISCFYYGKEIFEKQNPQTVFTEEYIEQPEQFRQTRENFSIAVGIQNHSLAQVQFIDESVYKAYIVNKVYKQVKNAAGENTGELDIKEDVLPMRPCVKDDFQVKGTEDYFNKLETTIPHLYCLEDYKTLNIEGDWGQDVFSEFIVRFEECNETFNTPCKPQEEKDAMLNDAYWAIYFTDKIVNPKNYTDPFQDIGRQAFSSTSNLARKVNTLNFRNIYMESNIGFLFDNLVSERQTVFSTETEREYPKNGNTIFNEVVFRFEKIKQTRIFRNYLNIATVLAQVGGLLKIAFMLFWFISYFLNQRDYDITLLNQIFNVEQKLKNKKEKEKKNQDVEKSNGTDEKDDDKPKKGFIANKITINPIKTFFSKRMLNEDHQKQKAMYQQGRLMLQKELDIIRVIQKLQQVDTVIALLFNQQQQDLIKSISKPVLNDSQQEITNANQSMAKLQLAKEKQMLNLGNSQFAQMSMNQQTDNPISNSELNTNHNYTQNGRTSNGNFGLQNSRAKNTQPDLLDSSLHQNQNSRQTKIRKSVSNREQLYQSQNKHLKTYEESCDDQDGKEQNNQSQQPNITVQENKWKDNVNDEIPPNAEDKFNKPQLLQSYANSNENSYMDYNNQSNIKLNQASKFRDSTRGFNHTAHNSILNSPQQQNYK